MSEANWYGDVFKHWSTPHLGPKPTADMLATTHALGCRPGKQAMAIAMSLRDCGVTGSQIVMACGAPQLNKMRGLVTDAYLKRIAISPAANGHKVYKLEVTAKGKQRIERAVKAAAALEAEGKAKADDKPVKRATKPKGAVKAKGKVKAPKADKPAAEPAMVPVPETAPVEQPTT